MDSPKYSDPSSIPTPAPPQPTTSANDAESKTKPKILATLALGSNLGDRFQNIERALRHLESFERLGFPLGAGASVCAGDGEIGDERPKDTPPGSHLTRQNSQQEELREELAVLGTSFLYETAPMYVTDQPAFVNCACLVRLSPFRVLDTSRMLSLLMVD